MEEKAMRLVQAQERARRLEKLNYFGQAADYLMEKGCFSGAAILVDFIEEEAREFAY